VLANPTATGKALVTRFFKLPQAKDSAGLRSFLSPAFQVQRADGTGSGKAAYLAKLPTVVKFTLTQVAATEADGALVVRYLATRRRHGQRQAVHAGPGPATLDVLVERHRVATCRARELQSAHGVAPPAGSGARV
jgi:hypothetical protein